MGHSSIHTEFPPECIFNCKDHENYRGELCDLIVNPDRLQFTTKYVDDPQKTYMGILIKKD